MRLCIVAFLLVTGCSTEMSVLSTVAGVTATGARTPAHEIEQVYYLGVFDPQEQIEPQIFRVTVHGQASAMSAMRFASGWVPAKLIDSLNTNITFNREPGSDGPAQGEELRFTRGAEDTMSSLKTGRRLWMFGPEGFREAPADHRLAIVMGSSPEAFFEAIDESLASISRVQQERRDSEATKEFFRALRQLSGERDRLDDIEGDVRVHLKTEGN